MTAQTAPAPVPASDPAGTDLHPLLPALLADDWEKVDAELPALLDLLFSRSAGEAWHKAGTFKNHLLDVYRTLALWDQPRDVRVLGLFHSVYSNEFVALKLFDASAKRAELAAAVGEEAERLIHTFCVMPRTRFVQKLTEIDAIPAGGLDLEKSDGSMLHLSQKDAAIFAIVSIADLTEQWHSWVDDVFQGFPWQTRQPVKENWAASLWPGQLMPSNEAWSLASRMARPLRDLPAELGLPVPPVFDRCRRILTQADEMAAVALYWQVVTRAHAISTPVAAVSLLKTAIAHNPDIAEPHLVLAQIALTQGDYDTAATHARIGLDILSAWGTAWDKRIAWSGWVAWARVLLQAGRTRSWPENLGGMIALGMVS
ncbi:hypothetical protein PJ900_01205 (plasmid) [Tistrella mobilis]|uniref:DUF6817 domain-containing protein n=1 Tax=Tistrella mobilis TaxID=171437 RepID=A0A161R7H2_9PROT|nr:hypothetical protein [Tistrella mobilis]KYO56824.1 hypothetical protein AUP44_21695 [Tistrella mobilis]